MPALVRDADDWERLDLALAENMAREDLNPVEEARACAMLVDDLGITKGEVGRRVGRSRVAISNLIRLLDLPDEALELIESGQLSEGHGRALLLCKDHDERRRLALAARDEGWSVRETEDARARRRARRAAKRPRRRSSTPTSRRRWPPPRTPSRAALGREVKVRRKGDGCRAEIDFEEPAEAVALAERDPRQGPARRRLTAAPSAAIIAARREGD